MFINQEGLRIQEGFQRLEALALKSDLPQGARFLTQVGNLDVSFYAPGIIRLRWEIKALPDYGLLVSGPEAVNYSFTKMEGGYRFESDELTLELLASPLRIRLIRGEEVILESVRDRDIQGRLRFAPFARGPETWMVTLALHSAAPIYGLGEKWGPLDRRGLLVESWNEDATTVNAELSYKNTPFAWSMEGWGLYVHTPARVTHGVGYPQWSHSSYVLKVHEPNLDLFIITGETPAEIISKYTHLTGRTPLPPRWSYGAWMSRAFYQTAEEALDVAQKLRQRAIPCDVITLDGRAWHKMETRFDFSWDPDRYPDPAGFVRRVRDLNLHLCLWEYPYISVQNPLFMELAEKGYLLKAPDGQPYIHHWLPWPLDTFIAHLQPSGIIDLTNPEAFAWYRDMHRELFEIGVSVMKSDYGEAVPEEVIAHNGDTGGRLHNIYALLYNRCVYEASQQFSGREGLVWGRAGWTGSQQFPVQWGGDPQCDWEGLGASIRGGLSWGMSGAPFYSHDIGGFAIGFPEVELYIRWAQAGILCSHTRFHGIGPREPWYYGEEAEAIVKKWLAWRYRLIPYLQGCALEASLTGLPVMRAMPLAFPHDRLAWSFEEQYMLGPALLVVPVLVPGGKVRFYLPAGVWYDIWSGERIEGPEMLERTVPLEHIPVFGRQGTVLPLGPAVQHTGELQPGVHLEEIWSFGKPDRGISLPGFDINVVEMGKIEGLPQGVQVRYW